MQTRLLVLTASLAIIIPGVLVIAAIAIPKFFVAPNTAAEFGDMFGVVNALFSGLAFLGVVVAILLQRLELSLQREDIRKTSDELAGQREQLMLQNEMFHQQIFDAAFFQMLSLHQQIVNAIDVGDQRGDMSGRDCFKQFYSRFVHIVKDGQQVPHERARQTIESAYVVLHDLIQDDVGHYFRYLYYVIAFVDRSDASAKGFYAGLIRAQLSSYELLLLFYHGLSRFGRDGLDGLIEKYALLRYVDTDKLIDSRHADWYQASAYES